MREALFTVVCEFRGGTYLAQLRGKDVQAAVRTWAERIATDPAVPDLPALQFEEQIPTRIVETSGVWCVSALHDSDLLLLHIVRTDPDFGEY